MTRTDLINSLARRRGLRGYLEIGVGDVGWNFDHVDCERKCAVDPAPGAAGVTHRATSDDYFRDNTESFDLIFIDGLHEEDQVLRDVRNALARLNPGGAVVIHDCLPPDAWHQRPYRDFRTGEDWNGTVWKAVLRLLADSPWEAYVVDCDWGCGVIDTAAPRRRPEIAVPDRLEYDEHFPMLRPFVRSEARFLTDLYGVTVFYHVAGIGDWRDVVEEHFRLLSGVGLDRVKISHVGSPDDLPVLARAADEFGLDAEVASHVEDLRVFETPAMQLIESWARDADGSLLYFHTKGVSSPGSSHKRKWRELMNRETLGRWKENVRELDRYDLVSVNWCDRPPIPHFPGNFWWARADWVRSLAPFATYFRNPRYTCDGGDGLRLGCEFWIGSASRPPRVKSLVCSNSDFCHRDAFEGLV